MPFRPPTAPPADPFDTVVGIALATRDALRDIPRQNVRERADLRRMARGHIAATVGVPVRRVRVSPNLAHVRIADRPWWSTAVRRVVVTRSA